MSRVPMKRHGREIVKRRPRRERRSVLPRRRVGLDLIKVAHDTSHRLRQSFGEHFDVAMHPTAGISGVGAGPILITTSDFDLDFSFAIRGAVVDPDKGRLLNVRHWEAGFETLDENRESIMKDFEKEKVQHIEIVPVGEKPGVIFVRGRFKTLDEAITWMKVYGSQYNHNIISGCPGGRPC